MSLSRKSRFACVVSIAITSAVAAVGCSKSGSGTQSSSQASTAPQLICNPFGAVPGANPNLGLAGGIYQFSNDELMASNGDVKLLVANSSQMNAILFLSDLNVPLTPFSSGFPLAGGGTLKDSNGFDLTHHFALSLGTEIRLKPTDPSGIYQFALMSDDGAIIRIDENADGNFDALTETLVDNNGMHSTRLACADRGIAMDATTKTLLKIDYFQGAPTELALTLLWRRVADNTPGSLADSACGTDVAPPQSINPPFFEADAPPATTYHTTAAYNSFLTNGQWSVVPADNYYLPAAIASNPCI